MDLPPKDFFNGDSWLAMLLYITFAMIGGVLGYIMRTLDSGLKVSFWRAVIEATGAGFVGVLVMLICQASELSPQWTGVIVGVCGWLGATSSIRMLEKVVAKKIGVKSEE